MRGLMAIAPRFLDVGIDRAEDGAEITGNVGPFTAAM